MGGLYGAANLVSADSPAFAKHISAPDLSKCASKDPKHKDCCPPTFLDYKLPPVTNLRFRPAAHLSTEEYIAKYRKAVKLMKALPGDDPRNFIQQANVHCAYCDLLYEQKDSPEHKLQIHFCWLFFPWHRWFLYFYERILGKLIDDPTFGMPFWNWDQDYSAAVKMPGMFLNRDSLDDSRRNPDHLPPSLADLNYGHHTVDHPDIICSNLTEMYGEMIRNAKTLLDFYGAKYVSGDDSSESGQGTVERGSHDSVHDWVGDPSLPDGEDMGNFYSAGRDPIFYSHHANIDRLWSIWRNLRGSKPKDFTDPDWLNANFLFYDENAQLVRVYVRDALEHHKMGYVYQEVPLPWLNRRPKARVKKSNIAKTTEAPKASEPIYPVKLDKVFKVLVDRPKTKRSKEEKEKEEELLVIEGIEVDTTKYARFEVYVNDEDDKPGQIIDKAEYAGCFSIVPHKNPIKVKSKIRLGLTEMLEDLDAEEDDKILVSLVPKARGEDIAIGGIKIIYDS